MSGTKAKVPEGYKIIKKGVMPSGKGPCMKIFYGGEWHDSDGSLGGEDVSILAKGWYAARPAKRPGPAKWAPIPADTKLTKAKVIALANKLGVENARLKNQLAKKGAKV